MKDDYNHFLDQIKKEKNSDSKLITCNIPSINPPPEINPNQIIRVDETSYTDLGDETKKFLPTPYIPQLKDLEKTVKEIDKGLKNLDKGKRIKSGVIPHLQNDLANLIRDKMGKEKKFYDLDELFPKQQELVFNLNQELINLINVHSQELDIVYADLEKIIDSNKYHLQLKEDINARAVPPQREKYKVSLANFKRTRYPDKDFHENLKTLVQDGRSLNDLIFKSKLYAIAESYDKKDIELGIYQANLFQKSLNGGKEVAYKAARYQRRLASTFRIYQFVRAEGRLTKELLEGIDSLVEFNNELNKSFTENIIIINNAMHSTADQIITNQTIYQTRYLGSHMT
ncbi:MAG: hypothetical protein PHG05_04205 [Candidatus Nanoarchaeia archaeon]|nr:hypothetical protein [Candidatus Nanoarchaeia archaeon]